jgi:leucyl/phenylalanyl-tRNA--protein transferase
VIPWLEADSPFPPVERALEQPNGLLCAGGDLSIARLLDAYRHGIFPWYSGGEPILWWSPDPRMVLFTDALKVSRSLAKSIRNKGYTVRVDTAFAAVLEGCAAPRGAAADDDGTGAEAGTWLGAAMRAAYRALHEAGYAHSVETWLDGELVGGLYGVALGRMFYGESMFSRAVDASKVALVALVERLQARGFPLIDCQVRTPLLAGLGAREIPRRDFLRCVAALVHYAEPVARWESDDPSRVFAPQRAAGSVQTMKD